MALRKIMTEKEPVLHKKCRPVTEFNSRLHQLLDDMRDTLEEANGAGPGCPPGWYFATGCGGGHR